MAIFSHSKVLVLLLLLLLFTVFLFGLGLFGLTYLGPNFSLLFLIRHTPEKQEWLKSWPCLAIPREQNVLGLEVVWIQLPTPQSTWSCHREPMLVSMQGSCSRLRLCWLNKSQCSRGDRTTQQESYFLGSKPPLCSMCLSTICLTSLSLSFFICKNECNSSTHLLEL
jgi:hypothetical protein